MYRYLSRINEHMSGIWSKCIHYWSDKRSPFLQHVFKNHTATGNTQLDTNENLPHNNKCAQLYLLILYRLYIQQPIYEVLSVYMHYLIKYRFAETWLVCALWAKGNFYTRSYLPQHSSYTPTFIIVYRIYEKEPMY